MPSHNPFPDLESVTSTISTLSERLPPDSQTPKTFLSLIHRASDELAWNHLLCHFLDPAQPHGIGDQLLLAFLSFLQDAFNHELEEAPSSLNTVVDSQPRTDADKIPDLALYEPGRWCVCIELKVHADPKPSQLHHYTEATTIGACDMTDIVNPFYLLIGKKKHRPSVRGTGFNFLSWTHLNEHVLRDYARTIHRQQVPMRPAFQLIEFSETIREELTMGGPSLSDREKQLCQLYLKHHTPIDEVNEAWNMFRKHWWDYFQDHCNALEDNPFAEDGGSWRAYPTYGHIFKTTWWLDDRGVPAADIGIAYRILFTHDLDKVCEGVVAWDAKCNTEFDDLRRTASFIDQDGDLDRKHTFVQDKEEFSTEDFPRSYFETLLKCFLGFREEYEEQVDAHMEEVQVELRREQAGS